MLAWSSLLLAAAPPVRAHCSGCAVVESALQALRRQPWVSVQGEVRQGRHPESYTRMQTYVLRGRLQARVLDGDRFGPHPLGPEPEARDLASGALPLLPAQDCELVGEEALDGQPTRVYDYEAFVGRSRARIRLWIAHDSGLPLQAHIDGPQMAYTRALSRPGKPPQAVLKASGQRYQEWQFFRYGRTVMPGWALGPGSQSD